jgi:hypothetical protein
MVASITRIQSPLNFSQRHSQISELCDIFKGSVTHLLVFREREMLHTILSKCQVLLAEFASGENNPGMYRAAASMNKQLCTDGQSSSLEKKYVNFNVPGPAP